MNRGGAFLLLALALGLGASPPPPRVKITTAGRWERFKPIALRRVAVWRRLAFVGHGRRYVEGDPGPRITSALWGAGPFMASRWRGRDGRPGFHLWIDARGVK